MIGLNPRQVHQFSNCSGSYQNSLFSVATRRMTKYETKGEQCIILLSILFQNVVRFIAVAAVTQPLSGLRLHCIPSELHGNRSLVCYMIHVLRSWNSMTRLRRLVAGFLPRKLRFASRWVHVWLAVDRVALRQVYPSPSVSPVSIIPPLLHIDACSIWGMDKRTVCGLVPQRESLPSTTITGRQIHTNHWRWNSFGNQDKRKDTHVSSGFGVR
jgi:hypothetical protein